MAMGRTHRGSEPPFTCFRVKIRVVAGDRGPFPMTALEVPTTSGLS